MWCHWHYMTQMAVFKAHGTDASTGTSTSTKGHIIPLNNHLNKWNGFTDSTISIMLLLCTCQKLTCPSNATYKLQMAITSCPHMTLLCQYICLIWIHCNQQCEQELWYTFILHHWHMPLNKYAYHTVHMCSTTLLLQSTYIYHITLHISKKTATLFIMLLPHMCQQQICPSNATYMPVRSCLCIRQLYHYIYLIWTHCSQHCHHKYWYTCISHY